MKEKKYALRNSYFKNRKHTDPGTLSGIVDFMEQYGELPFRYDGHNWVYDTVCEMQKRSGVKHSQYLTPNQTAERIAELTARYASERVALDACCGTGQLTGPLLSRGFEVNAFDLDLEMVAAHNHLFPEVKAVCRNYLDWRESDTYPVIVSHPPLEDFMVVEFFEWLSARLEPKGVAILLLPVGFVDKSRPKSLSKVLSQFAVKHREAMAEKFERTSIKAEIVVLENLKGYGL